MKYTPYTEHEIKSMNLMDEGIYKFQVMDVILNDKNGNQLQDKNGNDMAKLKLMVWDKESREHIIYTFISGDGNFAYKLRHYADTLGMVLDYEDGTFNIMRTIGKNGLASVIIKKGTTKADGSGELWPDRNDVKDFVVETHSPFERPKEITPSDTSSQSETSLDDDVPF